VFRHQLFYPKFVRVVEVLLVEFIITMPKINKNLYAKVSDHCQLNEIVKAIDIDERQNLTLYDGCICSTHVKELFEKVL